MRSIIQVPESVKNSLLGVLAASVVAAIVWILSHEQLRMTGLAVSGVSLVLTTLSVYLVTRWPLARLAVFVGGGLLVMQSSGGLSPVKMAYFAGVLVCTAIALVRVFQNRERWRRAYRPTVVGAGVLLAFIACVGVGSIVAGEDATRVARDALTYLLICGAPIIALDSAGSLSSRTAFNAVVVFSSVSAVGFAVYWLAARGVGTLGFDRLVMNSMMLAGLGAITGMIRGLTPKIHIGWLAFGLFAIGCVLITGARTGLVLIAILVVAVGMKKKFRVPPLRMLGGVAALGASALVLLPVVSAQVATEAFYQSRVDSLVATFEGGFDADASGVIRQRATTYALDIWRESPLFGVGLGHAFPNPNPMQPDADFQLDTPALYLAKFGIIGTIVIFGVLACFAFALLKVHKRLGYVISQDIGDSSASGHR